LNLFDCVVKVLFLREEYKGEGRTRTGGGKQGAETTSGEGKGQAGGGMERSRARHWSAGGKKFT